MRWLLEEGGEASCAGGAEDRTADSGEGEAERWRWSRHYGG